MQVRFYAGSSANTSYTFYSGATELVRIDASGNVGIGTNLATPQYDKTLHIEGANPTVRLETNYSAGWAYNQYVSPETTWSVGINNLDQFVIANSATLDSSLRLVIDDSNGNIDVAGNVTANKFVADGTAASTFGIINADSGIFASGITISGNPVSTGAAGGSLTLQQVTDNGATTTGSITASDFFIKDGSTQIGQLSKDISSSNFVIKSSVSDANLEFKGVDGGANITAMLIDMSEGGRVGIGSNTPARKLDVVGDAAVSTNLIVGTALYTNQWIASSSATQYIKNSSAATSVAITNAGNVGIGTTAPTAKLEVSGANTFRGVSAFYGSTTNELKALALQFDATYQGVSNVLRFRQGGSTAGGVAFSAYDRAPTLFLTYDSTSPRVGIGVANPDNPLEVSGSDNGIKISSLSSDRPRLTFDCGGAEKLILSTNSTYGAIGDSTDTNRYMVFKDGEVGIGTNAPFGKLDIFSNHNTEAGASVATSYHLHLHNPADDTSESIGIGFGITSAMDAIGAAIAHERKGSSSYGDLYFSTRPVGGNVTERMRITATGKVGIGTNAPAHELSVYKAGNVQVEITGTNVAILNISDPNSHGQLNTYNDGTFRINAQQNAGGTQLVLSGSDNVGIGTANPLSRLDVKHQIRVRDSSSDDTHALLDSNGTDGRLRINNGANWGLIARGFENSPAIGAYFLGNLRVVGFSTSDGANVNNELARFDFQKSGVGIGSNVPAAKLDVAAPVNDGIRIDENNALLGSDGTTTGSTQLIYWNGTHSYYGRYTTAPFNAKVNSHFFRTNGSNRLAITTSGVGVNTTSPATDFNVNGKVKVNGTSYHTWINFGSDEDTYIRGGKAGSEVFINDTHNSNVLIAGGGGNVGIGTDTPISRLNIKSSATSSEDSALSITQNGGANTIFAVGERATNGAQMLLYDGGTATHAFYTDGTDNYINAGNVGIGTNAPALPLHVEGSVLIDAYNQTSGSGQGIFFRQGFTSTNKYNLSILTHNDGDNSPDALDINAYDGINFCVGANTRNPEVSIKYNGAVGIGTTNPDESLRVVGGNVCVTNGQYFIFDGAGSKNHKMRSYYDGSQGHVEVLVGGTDVLDMAADGNVGIGTDVADGRLHIHKNSAGSVSAISQSNLIIENNSANAISMLTPNNTSSFLVFGDPDNNQIGYISYDHATDSMNFRTAGTNRIAFDPAGQILISGNPVITGLSSTLIGETGKLAHLSAVDADDVTVSNLVVGNIKASTLVTSSEGIGSNNNDTTIPTSAAVKAYADSAAGGGGGSVGTLQQVTDQGASTNNNITLASSLPKLFLQDVDGTNQIAEISKAGSHLYFYNRDNVSNGGYIFLGDNGTTDTEFMRISAAGNVGIGTNNPSYKLEIDGGDFLVNTTNGGYIQVDESDNSFKFSDENKIKLGTNNDIEIYHTDSADGNHYDHYNKDIFFRSLTNDKDIIIQTRTSDSQVEIMRFDGSSSRVGLGTNNPSHKLDVESADDVVTSFNSTDNKCAIALNDDDTTVYVSAESSRGAFGFQAGLHVNNINILSDGKVGIGTHNPSTNLHVTGSALIEGSVGDGVFSVTNAAGSQNLRIDQNSIRTTTANNLTFLAKDCSNSLVIQQSNNTVGIGTNDTSSFAADAQNLVVGSGAGGQGITIFAGTSSNASLIFADGTAGSNAYRGWVSYRHSSDRLDFAAGAGARMFLNGNGMSVGTATPGNISKLTISGSAGTDSIAHFVDGSDGVEITARGSSRQQIDFLGTNTSSINAKGSLHINYDTNNDGSNDSITFARNNDDEDGTVDMIIKEGKVGVGTNAPSQLLNVSGGHILIDHQDPQLQFNDTDGSTYSASWMYQNNAIKFVWGGGHKFKVDSAGGVTLGQSYSSSETAPSKGIITEGKVGLGTTNPAATLHVGDTTNETNGTAIISGTGTSTPAANLYVYGSGNGDVINAVRDRNDASIKVTSTTAGAYFRTNSATSTFNGLDLNSNWFIGQYGHNDLRIVDGTASAGDAAAAVTVQNSTKYVGIGTTDPDALLDITTTTNAKHLHVQGAFDGGNAPLVYIKTIANGNALLVESASTSDSREIFEVKNSNGAIFDILGNGNVGINVTDPDEKLEVAGKTHLGGRGQDGGAYIAYATLSETQGGAATILGNAVYAGTGSNVYRKTYSDAGNFISMTYNKGICFHTNVTGSAGSTEYNINNHEQVRITTGGSVGIGTDTPARILDVSTNGSDTYGIRNSYGASHYMEMAHNRFNAVGNNYIRFNIDDSTKMTIVDSDYGGGVNGVGIGTVTPSYELEVIGTTKSTYFIGGAYFEENASSSKLKFYKDGTVLVMDEDGELKPCDKENDTLVFGVSKTDFNAPVVLGAEPILVTGPIKVGDYIVTSNKQGHGQAMKEQKLGTIIAQAMENGDGESYNIKAMIRKM
jgi:hypothetical protein